MRDSDFQCKPACKPQQSISEVIAGNLLSLPTRGLQIRGPNPRLLALAAPVPRHDHD